MTSFVGIDIAKISFDAVLVQVDDSREHAKFDNDKAGFQKFKHWLEHRRVGSLQVCMEATGTYADGLAQFLYTQGYTVSVVNPARIRHYADSKLTRNKTDKLDAAVIADFCRTQRPPAWIPPDPAWKELQSLVRHLQDLERTRQGARNRLSAGPASPAVIRQLKDQIAFLDQQLKQAKHLLSDHIDHHPGLKHQHDLLTSIPGIGDLTAGKLLGEFRSIPAFDNPRQLVAFAGLNPKLHVSGSSVHLHSSISRLGRASIRHALYMPALVAKRCNPILSATARRLKRNGLSHKQVVVALMRKLLHIIYGVLKSDRPFDPNFSPASS